MKKCTRCKIEKELEFFVKDTRRKDSRGSYCVECESERLKEYYKKNDKRIIERQKNYSIENKDKVSEYQKEYRDENKERLYDYIKEYREINRDELNEKANIRKKTNPIRKLSHIVRNRIYVYFKSKNIKKKTKTFEMLGCSPEEFKMYIESLFTDGMTWDLVGKEIHIDHIIPLCSAKDEVELMSLCHYKNLQPLWKTTRVINGIEYIGNLNKSYNV